MKMVKTIYIMLQIAIFILTLFTFKPNSGDMRDDLISIGMLCLMGLMSFPISIVAAPLALGLSFVIVETFSILIGQYMDIQDLSFYFSNAFIFLSWLGMFICGYWQWFVFSGRSNKQLS